MVGHAGARLLADLAEATGLTAEFSAALGPLRTRGTGHVPGRIAVDLAVMNADGGETITDLAVLRDQNEMFGPVASTPTAWRLLAQIDDVMLASLRTARAQAREVAWLQAADRGEGVPAVGAAGREVPAWSWTSAPRCDLPFREAGRRADLQGRVRLPPAAVLPGQYRRGPGRAATAGKRQSEHRE